MTKRILYFSPILLILCVSIAFASQSRLQFLFEQLKGDPRFKVRIAAAYALAEIADGSVSHHLRKVYEEENNEAVRLAILHSMSQIPDPIAFVPLLFIASSNVLSNAEIKMMEQILFTHRNIFPRQDWMLMALTAPTERQRSLAYWIIGTFQDNTMSPILIQGLDDPSEMVQKRVLHTLPFIPSATTLQACEAFAQQAPIRLQPSAKLCVMQIQNALRNPIQTIQTLAVATKIQGKLLPNEVQHYFQRESLDTELDGFAYSVKPIQKKAKDISFVENDMIAATKIESKLFFNQTFQNRDIQIIKSFIKQKFPYIQGCYELELPNNPTLQGNVIISFSIHSTGIIQNAHIQQQSTLQKKSLHDCIISRVKDLQFPKIEQAKIESQYTFIFQPPKKRVYYFMDGF